MKVLIFTALSLLFTVYNVHAALWICGNETKFMGHIHADISQPPNQCPPDMNLHGITDSAVAMQQLGVIENIPKRYLKVVAGVVIEKAPEEKATVDQDIAAEEAIATELHKEKTNNSLCNEKNPVIIKQRLVTFKANLLADNEVQSRNRIAGAFEQLVLCLAARGQ